MVPVAAKAGVLLAVAAAGSTGVWYFSDSIFGTSLASVADETDQAQYTDGSIGKKYGKYFLSSKKNQKIWEERHKEHAERFSGDGANKAKDKFSTVTVGYSDTESDTAKPLNKICEAAYKETNTANLVDTDSSEASKFFKSNVWEFCGLGKIVTLDKEPTNGSATAYDTSKIGGDATNKKLFVSTKVDGNDWFWDLKTKEFWSGTPSLQGTDKTNNEFKKLAENEDRKREKTSIKNACEEAYKKTSSTDTSHKNKEDALTFCSIKLELSSTS